MRPQHETRFSRVVRNVVRELPTAIAVAVVDATTGMPLASHSNSPAFNPDAVAAYNSEVVRQKLRALAAMKLTDEVIDDILITCTTQLHLIKVVGRGEQFIYLAAAASDTNLAIARAVLTEQAALLT